MPARRLEWAVAGGFAAWAVARATAADRLPPTEAQAVALLAFTPQAAMGAWASALLCRDDRASALSAAAAGVLTAAVVPRGLGRRQPLTAGPVLRVMTANLLVGRADPEPLVGLVRAARPDVLFVQELTGEKARGLRFAGLDDLLPHALSDADAAEPRGNAIYSRYPLDACRPAAAAPSAQPVATLALGDRVAVLGCVHLHTPKPVRSRASVAVWRRELRGLPAIPAPRGAYTILAGDFNATCDHAEFRRLLGRGYADAASEVGCGLVPTWAGRAGRRLGLLTIDHVLADRRCAVLGTAVRLLPGSDHRAVIAAIRLP